jgi:hypothetical protein
MSSYEIKDETELIPPAMPASGERLPYKVPTPRNG